MASSGTETPVGLFGFVRKTTRVAGVIAAQHLVERELEIGPRHYLHQRPPATAVSKR